MRKPHIYFISWSDLDLRSFRFKIGWLHLLMVGLLVYFNYLRLSALYF